MMKLSLTGRSLCCFVVVVMMLVVVSAMRRRLAFLRAGLASGRKRFGDSLLEIESDTKDDSFWSNF